MADKKKSKKTKKPKQSKPKKQKKSARGRTFKGRSLLQGENYTGVQPYSGVARGKYGRDQLRYRGWAGGDQGRIIGERKPTTTIVQDPKLVQELANAKASLFIAQHRQKFAEEHATQETANRMKRDGDARADARDRDKKASAARTEGMGGPVTTDEMDDLMEELLNMRLDFEGERGRMDAEPTTANVTTPPRPVPPDPPMPVVGVMGVEPPPPPPRTTSHREVVMRVQVAPPVMPEVPPPSRKTKRARSDDTGMQMVPVSNVAPTNVAPDQTASRGARVAAGLEPNPNFPVPQAGGVRPHPIQVPRLPRSLKRGRDGPPPELLRLTNAPNAEVETNTGKYQRTRGPGADVTHEVRDKMNAPKRQRDEEGGGAVAPLLLTDVNHVVPESGLRQRGKYARQAGDAANFSDVRRQAQVREGAAHVPGEFERYNAAQYNAGPEHQRFEANVIATDNYVQGLGRRAANWLFGGDVD